ncbi:MAG: arsenic resistance protein [Anaerosomatales bacterium]
MDTTHNGAGARIVRLARRLSASLVWAIPLSMAAGFGAGLLVDLDPLKSLVLPLTMLMVYPMLVNVKMRDAFSLVDSRVVGVAMALNFLVLPVGAWVLAKLFFASDAGLFVGMVLAGLFPTSGMTISWTGFAKGNVGAAIKMTVVGLIAASLLAPVYLKVLAGRMVPVDLLGVLGTVVLVVALPLAAAQLTRVVLLRRYGNERFATRIAPVFPGISVLGVLGIVFIAVGLKAEMIVERPELTLAIAAPVLLFYLANFALSTLVGRALFGRGDAIALVYGTVMRNLSIALGIAVTTFGPEAALVLAAGYIVQVQAAAWYVRLTDRVFGPAAPTSRPAADG